MYCFIPDVRAHRSLATEASRLEIRAYVEELPYIKKRHFLKKIGFERDSVRQWSLEKRAAA